MRNDIEIKVRGEEFILVEAESLSLDDEFIQWEPKCEEEKRAKILIMEAINKGVKNFYRPKCDPSYTEDEEWIHFIPEEMPAFDKSCNWWKKIAKRYCPERNSRLGTRLQYGAFLGVLIKKLVQEGKSVEWAWNAVCNNSRELGNYYDSDNTTYNLELTGSNCVCGFYDLANTLKIITEENDGEGYWLAGGDFRDYGEVGALSNIEYYSPAYRIIIYSVGWIVLD